MSCPLCRNHTLKTDVQKLLFTVANNNASVDDSLKEIEENLLPVLSQSIKKISNLDGTIRDLSAELLDTKTKMEEKDKEIRDLRNKLQKRVRESVELEN